jgi:hypothetical protein
LTISIGFVAATCTKPAVAPLIISWCSRMPPPGPFDSVKASRQTSLTVSLRLFSGITPIRFGRRPR